MAIDKVLLRILRHPFLATAHLAVRRGDEELRFFLWVGLRKLVQELASVDAHAEIDLLHRVDRELATENQFQMVGCLIKGRLGTECL
ncbi:hypothetical protein CA85_24310 [Allorhodopirellula solitaria]|uniref:Uncharacterized protein n=1 Tax=Allorhodopirellula solitaria TaxID=2527987 RepID=A0A5C5XY18_9BACT|nr:hypothetical protein CA85_24310 [Allorhodopirellula solitaria]